MEKNIEKLNNLLKEKTIKGIAIDSREVRDGYMFIARQGHNVDSHDYIDDAVQRGASVVVAEKDVFVKQGVRKFVIENTKKFTSDFSNQYFNCPFDTINTVGITGTNGKTTISYLIDSVYKMAGFSTGVIGTINYRVNGRVIPASNTTPGAPLIYKLGADMKNADIDNCVMEVSSHALAQGRVDKIKFNFAVFTNFKQDHLDYHKNKKDYFKQKLKLFETLGEEASAVLNRDDAYFKKIKRAACVNIFSYGYSKKSDIRCVPFDNDSFLIAYPEGEISIKNKMIGKYNIYNMLAAFSVAYLRGIDVDVIKQGIENCPQVPGRMEKIEWQKKGVDIYIDYAHTPDGLKNVLDSLKEKKYKRIVLVFGCGGNRDKEKRHKMGAIACKYADFSFITSDNPRQEDVNDIISNIVKGFGRKSNYETYIDRKKAILQGLGFAEQGDVVLIAGKGHENYQIIGSVMYPFNDKIVVKEIIA